MQEDKVATALLHSWLLTTQGQDIFKPTTVWHEKFICLTSVKVAVETVNPFYSANSSFALSSNPVQLPKDSCCRLAQHIEVGLHTSRRQRVIIGKMVNAWTLGTVRGGTKTRLLYQSFEFHLCQDFKARTVTWSIDCSSWMIFSSQWQLRMPSWRQSCSCDHRQMHY